MATSGLNALPKRTRLPAGERKAEIVETALRLAETAGPDALTTEMIAKAIGLTQPALFRHFPRKEAIWTAVAGKLAVDMATARAAAIRTELPPGEAVLAIAMAQAGMIASTPGLAAILFSRELHVRNAELRAGMAANQKALHAELSREIERGKRERAFRGDLDVSDAAFLVIGVVQSLSLRWSLTGKRLDLLGETQRLVDLLLAGFADRPA
ncbi:MAG: TetR/AcrR family transcriptional regulator [Phyllobacteriaceae bacterium]|nr:TetR/AcrR family transcriptional regulator [Phyllobacteriaceae bacterium]